MPITQETARVAAAVVVTRNEFILGESVASAALDSSREPKMYSAARISSSF